jgi:hypothetical protein
LKVLSSHLLEGTEKLRRLTFKVGAYNGVSLGRGLKWPWRVADHSSLSSAAVKNVWSDTSTLPHVFMSWRVVKYRDFLFTLHVTYRLGIFKNVRTSLGVTLININEAHEVYTLEMSGYTKVFPVCVESRFLL